MRCLYYLHQSHARTLKLVTTWCCLSCYRYHVLYIKPCSILWDFSFRLCCQFRMWVTNPFVQVLDDADLSQLQPVILVSDSEDDVVAPNRFVRLAMVAHEIDLDPADGLVEGKEECEDGALSPIRGDESPHHRRAKIAFGNGEPASPMTQTHAPGRQAASSSEVVNQLESLPDVEMTRASTTWSSGIASWTQEDPVSDSDFCDSPPTVQPRSLKAPHLRVSLNLATKWGRCPHSQCLHSLKPWIFKTGSRRGQLVLMCSRWWSRVGSSQRACWGRRPFPANRFNDLPRFMQK